MAAPNKLTYLLEAVRSALATEPTFTVQRVLNKTLKPTAQRTIVYPFIVTVTPSTMVENSRVHDYQCTIRIWGDVAISSEGATPTGKSFEAYSETMSKIEACIRSIALDTQETHNDSTTTAIRMANVTMLGGHIDNGDNKVEVDCDVTLSFGHWA